ncbi:pirin family protein [Gaoshiqia sediminis]|uniref:Pirin family protein n=1 Tax=Gaoshiqia sediminis TaxID=2986998 RepID=A0AA42C761_9BACT|nr:pirin family protein [Gaoshiqia sediminis]MCW0483259.1 pirin family protein [Gaoshiqia sediminis]
MKTILHKSETRGHANHGWLDTHHTFSFANYYNPERIHFGALRVLNDDTIAGGRGFGTHPHDNMEIITIPLSGDLEHSDSMGNTAVIKEGDVQVMSAGSGIFHSEYNKNADKQVSLLQIWVLPERKQVTPRYDQISLSDLEKENEFYQILSPNPDDAGVWIYQQAWFCMGKFSEDKTRTYQLKNENNGLYVFVIDGKVNVGGNRLEKRDGLGIWETQNIELSLTKGSQVLLMEVPMRF